jgi:hypothetical protein
MIGHTDPRAPAPPSLGKLARTTAIAMAVAALLLVALVLPAEYGIDPLGTGRRLGLTAIASPPAATESIETPTNPEEALMIPAQRGPVGEYPRPFKTDVYEVVLAAREGIEYKYHLEKGAAMFYAWTAGAPVIYDFHGERSGLVSDGGPSSESYDKGTRARATGSFSAPFGGIHGWYWENTGSAPVTVRLTSSGFYNSAVVIHPNGTRKLRELQPLDAPPPTPAPTPEKK